MTDSVEVTAPSDPLDPEMEQAIREVVFASHDVGLFASDKYVRFEIEQVDALRSAIRSALAEARAEGRKAGIEEAAKLEKILAVIADLADHQIPFYAYGDSEAGVALSHLLDHIRNLARDARALRKEVSRG